MSKFAKTLKKNFLPVLIASVAIMVIDSILVRIYGLISRLIIVGTDLEMTDFTDYLSALSPKYNWFDGIMGILKSLIVSPLYIGLFRFLFKRLEGEDPKIGSVFDFYRSKKRFIGAFVVREIYTVLTLIFSLLLSLVIIATSNPFALYAVSILNIAIMAAAWVLLWFAGYEYAKTPENGIIAALKSSALGCLKSIKTFGTVCAVGLFSLGVTYLQGRILLLTHAAPVFLQFVVSVLLQFAALFLTMWVSVTAAYLILYKSPAAEVSDNEDETEDGEEEPFIKPYDFYIEADERYDASKTVETEDIRALDPLEVLESMELCFEVINHSGVRRKLKRLFDDLAFEVGEYVTYNGGRSVSGSVTEEIDERELEISVEISRASDSEPFTAEITISQC